MIIVVTGATGSGKSALAVDLAQKIGGEVVNADAFQVYQELNIATAKPSLEQRSIVPHHLFDFVPLTESYDIRRYQADLRKCLDDILSRGKTPIIAGGSGLYIRAGLYDYSFPESPEVDLSYYQGLDNESLHQELEKLDPIEAGKIHPNNRVRVLRAIEIYLSNGKSKSEIIANQRHEPIYECRFFGLSPERETLYEAVERRVDSMFEAGLVEENKVLIEKYGRDAHAFQAIGVKELFPYFDGLKTLEECKDDIKKATRHYVKRQDTFFAHQFAITWISGVDDIIGKL
ncbi:MAG: tRNA (adenosine(37)-N6)-dimethylallyltransferase MiaA [Bacillota bacterium]|nr:tRNA (adenosine(37)-N6)-dimethylallyltransferase MiaA [Bacillota bacterium]